MTLDIGEKLDTIAQLLAGAPPGPEEKFLFQKYVYCKEDYTSWVVSLLGDLGIKYTQVDSLVNGLYEYRCECTNDAFNQMILKVELSTNPVLATYKKIDSFSDLVGINVFDMDSYAAGCDSRISKSTTINEEMIQYWLNAQNDQIVQRQLDLAGSASIGTYSIDFTGGNVISGSVPVNGSIRDNILYRKKIAGSAFDYSLTNCTIEGWIIDLQKKAGDVSTDYTIVVGGASAENAFDDNLGSYAGIYDVSTSQTIWEVSFGSRSLDEVHAYWYCYIYANTNTLTQLLFELKIDDSWTVIAYRQRSTAGIVNQFISTHLTTGWDNVSGIRYRAVCNVGSHNVRLKQYDVSAFP